MAKSKRYYIRKSHRYLGIILGIQFLVWTISGLYFSWTDIDEIHGDFQRRQPPMVAGNAALTSPASVFTQANISPDSLHALQLLPVLGQPHYYIEAIVGGKKKKYLADATTGQLRGAVNKEEAIAIAAESFAGKPALKDVQYLTGTDSHHEYREKPLPAWAVTFDHPTSTTVYVSAERGKVESFRNNKWRLFDFLWMGHTMDYQGRDDFNNWLLRIFSLFSLVTVLSGFVLYWVSSPSVRKLSGNAKRR